MKVLTHSGLSAWLDGLARESTLIAPVIAGGRTLFRAVADSSEIFLDSGKTDLPPKEHFVPSTQGLFHIHRDKKGLRLEEPSLDEERTLFGIRPCDARALRVLDALFLDKEPVDPYYAARRAGTTLVGLTCAAMGEECFCSSVGVQPDDSRDVDVLLTPIEREYAVQVVTQKGERAVSQLALEVHDTMPPRPAVTGEQVPILDAEAWPQHFDHAYWSRLSDRCLSCRVCTYVCPTCRCFDVRDQESPDGSIERLCVWDSCMAEGYRRIAGGHNPRPTKRERLRNRFYCKFCYYPQDFGPKACVGCGRCIAKCPVNVDVAEVMQHMATW